MYCWQAVPSLGRCDTFDDPSGSMPKWAGGLVPPGVRATLVSILGSSRYIYCGEVLLRETSLENFMDAANKLQIKGLLGKQGPSKEKHDEEAMKLLINKATKSEEDKAYLEEFLQNETNLEKMIEAESNSENKGNDQVPLEIYQVGDKNRNAAKSEEQNAAIKSVSCSSCDYKTNTKENLRIHTKSIHEGIKHPCDQCDYKATQKSSLNIHKQSIHEGITYPCKQCDYKAKTTSKLK